MNYTIHVLRGNLLTNHKTSFSAPVLFFVLFRIYPNLGLWNVHQSWYLRHVLSIDLMVLSANWSQFIIIWIPLNTNKGSNRMDQLKWVVSEGLRCRTVDCNFGLLFNCFFITNNKIKFIVFFRTDNYWSVQPFVTGTC